MHISKLQKRCKNKKDPWVEAPGSLTTNLCNMVNSELQMYNAYSLKPNKRTFYFTIISYLSNNPLSPACENMAFLSLFRSGSIEKL